MKTKHFYKSLFILALPIFMQEFINAGVNLIDSLMVGSLGLNAINGVGLAGQLTFLCMLVMFGINSGSAIFMGQFWGKGDTKSIHQVMGICFASNMVAACAFAFGAFAFPHVLLGFYSNEPEVIRQGSMYLRVIGLSFFLYAITSTINASLRSIGQTKMPMFTTMIALLANASLTGIAIFVLDWGVVGAAIATVIARVLELAAQILIVKKLHLPIGTKLRAYFTADKKFLRNFFKITTPVILNESIWALGTSLYNLAYKACGNEAQGAMQIGAAMLSVFNVLGMGIGSACGIMLANLLGAGERDKAIESARRGLVLACGISLVMGVVLIGISPAIIAMYDISAAVKEQARLVIFVIAVGLVLKTYNYTTIVGILRSGGDTLFCLVVDAAGVWLVGLPLALAGAVLFELPVHWVLLLVYSEEVFKFILTTVRVFRNKWAAQIV